MRAELNGSLWRYCICKNQSQISLSCHLRSFTLKFFSSGPTIVGPILDSGYEGMYNTLVNFAYKTLVILLSCKVLHL